MSQIASPPAADQERMGHWLMGGPMAGILCATEAMWGRQVSSLERQSNTAYYRRIQSACNTSPASGVERNPAPDPVDEGRSAGTYNNTVVT